MILGVAAGRLIIIGVGGAVALFAVAVVDIVLAIGVWRGCRAARATAIATAALSVPAAWFVPMPGAGVVAGLVAALIVSLLVAPGNREYLRPRLRPATQS